MNINSPTSCHRPAFFSDPDFPRLLASDDPLAGPVSGMIEERSVIRATRSPDITRRLR